MLVKKIVRAIRSIAKRTLHSYLYHRKKLLMFGYYPGIKLKFISASDPIYKELRNALLRCRAFPGDLEVWNVDLYYYPYFERLLIQTL